MKPISYFESQAISAARMFSNNGTFPYSQNAPPMCKKIVQITLVARAICPKLINPKIPAGSRYGGTRAPMRVPVAAMNKYDSMKTGKYEVWTARKAAVM